MYAHVFQDKMRQGESGPEERASLQWGKIEDARARYRSVSQVYPFYAIGSTLTLALHSVIRAMHAQFPQKCRQSQLSTLNELSFSRELSMQKLENLREYKRFLKINGVDCFFRLIVLRDKK